MYVLTLISWEPASWPFTTALLDIDKQRNSLTVACLDEKDSCSNPQNCALPIFTHSSQEQHRLRISSSPWPMGTQLPFLFTVRCGLGLLTSSWHRGYKTDICKLSSSMQYGPLHMSSTVTPYVFRESEDWFPSKSLLLALPPSLPNCQAMNFNLEELLHLSLWICSTLDKFEDLCSSPMGSENIFEAQRVHAWLPFHCCE